MKKTILTLFVISMMTGFLITCTLPRANAESAESGQAQEAVMIAAGESASGQLTETPPSEQKNEPQEYIDSVEVSVAEIIKKAKQGDIYAQYDLALLYVEGKRVPKNNEQASSLIEKAANGGHLAAQKYLASLYESGKMGFPKDKKKAKYWSNLRGRLPSSTAGSQMQDDGSKKGIPLSVFAVFTALIVFVVIGVAFVVNKKKIKTNAPAATETISLDSLEGETDISFDDLSDK